MWQGESLLRSERRQQFVNTRPFEEDICSSNSCNNGCYSSCYNSSNSCCCYCCCFCCCCQLDLATFSANAMTQFVATTFHMSLVAVAQPPQQIPIDLEADRTLSHSHSSHRSSSFPFPPSLTPICMRCVPPHFQLAFSASFRSLSVSPHHYRDVCCACVAASQLCATNCGSDSNSSCCTCHSISKTTRNSAKHHETPRNSANLSSLSLGGVCHMPH